MKVVIITGGSRGIGASAALECVRRGLGVILTYNKESDKADQVVAQIIAAGGKAAALQLDVGAVGTFREFRRSVERTLAAVWGINQLSGLVNNAGYGQFNPIEHVTETEFDGLLNVHLKATWPKNSATAASAPTQCRRAPSALNLAAA